MPNVSLLEYAASSNPGVQGVVEIITNKSVFMRRLRFVQVEGLSYPYEEEGSTGTVSFRALNEQYPADVGVVNPKVELLKPFGGLIKTDRLLARGPKGTAVRADRIARKVKRAALTFDKTVILGDSSQDPKVFDGLRRRIVGKQLITMAANGAVLNLDKLDEALDAVAGADSDKIIVCNKAVRRQIAKLVIQAAGGAAVADVRGKIPDYKGAQIEVIDEDGDTDVILPFSETQGNSNACTSLYVCNVGGDTDQENFRGLMQEVNGQMIERVDYGERSGQFEDLVEAVAGIAVFNGRSVARIAGIKAS